ncbi:MAG: outer membrane protein transport protein [Kiritimatiellae bacterium]|nr:outer membrane protein transport protein [Kiritimatiellia bacterium]
MFTSSKRLQTGFAAMIITLGIAVTASYGAGFAIIEQSVKGMGNAYSGGSTASDDASCIFFNPAGMSLTGKTEVDVGAAVIIPHFSYNDSESDYPRLGMPLSGGDGGDAGTVALVPNFYYNQMVSERIAAGIGVNAPFGLATEYEDDWKGRYHALRSDVATVNINPSMGFQLTDWLSVGAGLNVEYATAELTSAVDFGGILASKGVAGASPQMLDGKAEIKGDDWGYGYNAGLMILPTKSTVVGLTYRSEVAFELEGDAKYTTPAQARALQAMGLFVDTDVKADLTLPETISFGVAQKLSSNVTLKADILWTRWSRFEELRVRYDSNQPDSVTEEDWEDVFRYALGLDYAYNQQWTFRVGTAYDESPIKNSQHRTPRIPDANRIWLSCGASYQATENIGIDAGYTHLFFNNSDVDNVGPTGDNLQGSFEGEANLISLQLCYNF